LRNFWRKYGNTGKQKRTNLLDRPFVSPNARQLLVVCFAQFRLLQNRVEIFLHERIRFFVCDLTVSTRARIFENAITELSVELFFA